jgi:hypothetical protein
VLFEREWGTMKKILNKKGLIMLGPIIVAAFIAGFVLGLYVGRYMPID